MNLGDLTKWLSPIGWIPGIARGLNNLGDQLSGSGNYNPAKKAAPYFDMSREQYLPYQQHGLQAYGPMNDIFTKRTQDPMGQYNEIMSGYQESPGYQRRKENALAAAGNAAAAGGMRGSIGDISNESQISDALLQGDMGDWYKNVYGMQNSGLEGLGNFYNKGFEASNDIANTYGSQGGMEFQNQTQQNQQMMDLIKALIGALGKAGGAAMGTM